MARKIRKLPLALKFTPDVPVSALAVDEYADGSNVEYDVRGIRSVAGETQTLPPLPSNWVAVFTTSGYRANGVYYVFVAATTRSGSAPFQSKWFMLNTSLAANNSNAWVDVTPYDSNGIQQVITYLPNANITASWNGTNLVINDTVNAPFFMTETDTIFNKYAQVSSKLTIWNIIKNPLAASTPYTLIVGARNTCNISGTTLTIPTAPSAYNEFYVGMLLEPSPGATVNGFISGTVITAKASSTSYTVSKSQTVVNGDLNNNQWPQWSKTVSNPNKLPWERNIDLVITGSLGGYDNYTWVAYPDTTSKFIIPINVKGATTSAYVPNDAWPTMNVSATVRPKYVWNYNPEWKSVTANFVRLFSTQNVGSILVAGGLTVVNGDDTKTVYSTTIQWSQAFGINSVPLTWEPTITNVANQVEAPVTGTLLDGYQSDGNFYISTYVDTAIMAPINYTSTSAPILSIRQFNPGRGMYSSNCWVQSDTKVFGVDSRDVWEFSDGQFKSLGNQTVKNFLSNAILEQFIDRVFMIHNSSKYQIEIYYPSIGTRLGAPNKMLAYRYDVGAWNPPRDVFAAQSGFEGPLLVQSTVGADTFYTPYPNTKIVTYVSGNNGGLLSLGQPFLMKDIGYNFAQQGGTNPTGKIDSYFVKNGIPLAETFNQKSTVFRVYPELSQLGTNYETNRNTQIEPVGTIKIEVNGSNSPGTPYNSLGEAELPINSLYADPYIQLDQNISRTNGIKISGQSDASTPNVWYASAVTIMYDVETEEV